MKPTVKKNDRITLEITALTNEGNGIGRQDGFALFVPGAAVGDLVQIKVLKVLKNYGFAKIEALLRPSPHRIADNGCPVYLKCGGCSLRHISYQEECRLKQQWTEDNLQRIGGISLPFEPFLPSPTPERYRNKAQYPIGLDDQGNLQIGFFAKRSHRIIPTEDCVLQPVHFQKIVSHLRSFFQKHPVSVYRETEHTGLLRHLYLRYGEETGQTMVCLVINGTKLPCERELIDSLTHSFPEITTILLNSNRKKGNVILGDNSRVLYGKGTILDRLCGVEIELSPLSFYQVNRRSAENLYRCACEMAQLQGQEILLDLFCGTGTIGLSMAGRVKQLIGVEIIPQAVEDARKNAARNGIQNARFLCADASAAAQQLLEEGISPHIVVFDPPRKGCDPAVLHTVAQMGPQKIIMISCNSATMARDCKLLEELGYSVKKAQAVDMFPRTGHVETVVLLSKGERGFPAMKNRTALTETIHQIRENAAQLTRS